MVVGNLTVLFGGICSVESHILSDPVLAVYLGGASFASERPKRVSIDAELRDDPAIVACTGAWIIFMQLASRLEVHFLTEAR